MDNKTDKSKYFFFYEEYANTFSELTDEQVGRAVKVMCKLMFGNDEESEHMRELSKEAWWPEYWKASFSDWSAHE